MPQFEWCVYTATVKNVTLQCVNEGHSELLVFLLLNKYIPAADDEVSLIDMLHHFTSCLNYVLSFQDDCIHVLRIRKNHWKKQKEILYHHINTHFDWIVVISKGINHTQYNYLNLYSVCNPSLRSTG